MLGDQRGCVVNKIYLVFTCPECDEDMYYGPVVSLLPERRGIPVFPGDTAEQLQVTCEECGSTTFFGDLDYEVETPE